MAGQKSTGIVGRWVDLVRERPIPKFNSQTFATSQPKAISNNWSLWSVERARQWSKEGPGGRRGNQSQHRVSKRFIVSPTCPTSSHYVGLVQKNVKCQTGVLKLKTDAFQVHLTQEFTGMPKSIGRQCWELLHKARCIIPANSSICWAIEFWATLWPNLRAILLSLWRFLHQQ